VKNGRILSRRMFSWWYFIRGILSGGISPVAFYPGFCLRNATPAPPTRSSKLTLYKSSNNNNNNAYH